MSSGPSLTFTTLCDRRFLWGAFLLAASIRRSGLPHPIHFLQTDTDRETAALLGQFDGAKIIPLAAEGSPLLSKPQAMLSATTDFSVWIDCDCLVVGDISALVFPPNGEFQIRMCSREENQFFFKTKCGNRYAPGDDGFGIPVRVLDAWRRDVADRQEPAIQTLCQADTIVVHRRHFGFIEKWRDQMGKVMRGLALGRTVDRDSFAYFMTDMSVLSSLLAFSSLAPPRGGYLLHKNPAGFIGHFGARPKPWNWWTVRTFGYFDEVASNIEWARLRGFRLPRVPWHFERRYRGAALAGAYARAAAFRIANFCGAGRNLLPES